MQGLSLPVPLITAPQGRTTRFIAANYAANAGASVMASIAVPKGCFVYVNALIHASAGSAFTPIAVTADSDTDLFTATAHGLGHGTPVIVKGATQPTGVSATTIYFARAASSSTISIYDTHAHAVAGGGTGQALFTGNGTSVVIYPQPLAGFYIVDACGINRAATTALVGSANVVAFEETDCSAWAATIAANDSTDTLDVTVTPDATAATRFEAELNITVMSAKAN
jgi:hypothetical protein